eukprot:TRINITY_DN5204_c0_g2_i1.p1 TRINITY_DN5204_c0_g2~~TRINITY_DN5204_c0_g2_i1.p1  ORF type:complete len:306 (-),score=47.54 TRINITY_DN5204_c0_g2_i1:446-1339(-)
MHCNNLSASLVSPEEFCTEIVSLSVEKPAQSRRVTSRAADAIQSPDDFRLFLIRESAAGAVGAVAYHVHDAYAWAAGVVSAEVASELIEELLDEFGFSFSGFAGFDGPPAAVEALTIACSEAFDRVPSSRAALQTMILEEQPRETVGVPGTLKVVRPDDKCLLSTLAFWFEQFEKDLEHEDHSLVGHEKLVDDLSAAAGRRNLFAWEVKEKPVAMVMIGRSRPKQLLCVYTVPQQRGKGYAQAATAAACARQWTLNGCFEPITLAADRKFGAQRIYERIGFRSDGDLHGVTFDDWTS